MDAPMIAVGTLANGSCQTKFSGKEREETICTRGRPHAAGVERKKLNAPRPSEHPPHIEAGPS